MNNGGRKLACFLLLIIIFLSIILIYKIKSTPKYNEKLYDEIYQEYKKILTISEEEKINTNEKDDTIYMLVNAEGNRYRVAGTIKIPKIDVQYPVVYETTDEYLKIAPTKLFGPNINEIGNVCIVGHNYKNKEFFSRLSKLEINDKIFLMDNKGKELIYLVYDKFEVDENDLSCTNQETNGKIEATLITCTNKKKTRLIVKCRAINT